MSTSEYKSLDLPMLSELDEKYTRELANYFAPLVPQDFVLKTKHEQGEVIVYPKGGHTAVKVTGGVLTFKKCSDVELNNQLLILSARILEFYDNLTRYKIEISGLKVGEKVEVIK